MKNVFTTILVLLILSGCQGKNDGNVQHTITVADIEKEFTATLTHSDTTQVLSLGAEILDSLKAGNMEWAISTLCELDSAGMVRPLDEQSREKLKNRFRMFPVRDYELDYYTFSMPKLNDLKYRTYFTDHNSDGKGGAAMSMMFNPVYESGQWYMCLKEASQPARDASNALNPNLIIEN